MTHRSSNIVLEFLLDGDRLPVLALRAVQVVLPFERLTQALVRHTDHALFITHFVNRQAAQNVVTRHRDLASQLIALPDLHVLLSETLTIAPHTFESGERAMIIGNSLLQVPMTEVVICEIAEHIKSKHRIIDLLIL